jgi:hypothetical protein
MKCKLCEADTNVGPTCERCEEVYRSWKDGKRSLRENNDRKRAYRKEQMSAPMWSQVIVERAASHAATT